MLFFDQASSFSPAISGYSRGYKLFAIERDWEKVLTRKPKLLAAVLRQWLGAQAL